MDSYTDPDNAKPYDFGVMVFTDYGNASGFFERFNIPVSTKEMPSLDYLYADFNTGQHLSNYTSPSWEEELTALEAYVSVAEKYEDCMCLYAHSDSYNLFKYWLIMFRSDCSRILEFPGRK